MSDIQWPDELVGRLDHIVVNVYPTPADPGKNVRVVGELFKRLLGVGYSSKSEPTPWGSEVFKLIPCHTQYIGLHVHDWSPEDAHAWGGHSDNLLSVSMVDRTANEAAQLLFKFFQVNGYREVSFEEVSLDGSYDLWVRDLFVSFVLNVNPG